MRPLVGVGLELAALVGFIVLWPIFPKGPIQVLYLVSVQALATYLIHCPAHYFTGVSLGIKFREIRLRRTTLGRALPIGFARLAKHLPILSLSVDKVSQNRSPRARVRAMYYSGVVASCASAFAVATYVSLSGDLVLILVAWAFALGYAGFDAIASPRGGDIFRARKFV